MKRFIFVLAIIALIATQFEGTASETISSKNYSFTFNMTESHIIDATSDPYSPPYNNE